MKMKQTKKNNCPKAIILILIICILTGCKKTNKEETFSVEKHSTDISKELKFTHTVDVKYATQYSIDEFEGGYALITIGEDCQYLLVPENGKVPGDIDKDIVIIKQPLNNIYLVSSSTMDMFIAMNGLQSIRYTALAEDNWYLEDTKEALRRGDMVYAGKYSAPDYELLLDGGCDIAIENTMIYHTPEVKEMIESLDIPVLVDYSSYEKDPLGRMEWIKLYGRLAGHELEADEAYDRQKEAYNKAANSGTGEYDTGVKRTVAIFYITSDGQVSVRCSDDYLAKMIGAAGGEYIYKELVNENSASGTKSMTIEQFYKDAIDADYIIYNSSIDGEVRRIDDLISKNEMLGDFKAVKEGNVFCMPKNVYQSSMELGTITEDMYYMLSGQDELMEYIYRVE